MTDVDQLRDGFARKDLDVVALGAAIVDILARVDDAFLAAHDIAKGGMTLVDAERAETIHGAMRDPREVAGGSAANTVAGVAALGGVAAFAGKTKDDRLGNLFRAKMAERGVRFDTPHGPDDLPGATARSMILVTPDAERSMCTDLGVSGLLYANELPRGAIESAKITYLEGYLWDSPDTKHAFEQAVGLAEQARGLVALTLSDTFCVERHRESFKTLVSEYVDILFANEEEILALYQTRDLEEATVRAERETPLAIITRSEKGCIVAADRQQTVIPAYPIEKLVDTTGAGDAFAAGFLLGFCHGRDLETCGRMGCLAAAEVIQHLGARPEHDMKAVFRENGFLDG